MKKKPGDMFNAFQKKKRTLRSPKAVVKSEQEASHQFTKSKKKKTIKKKNDFSPENYGPNMKSAFNKKYGGQSEKMQFQMPGSKSSFSIGKTAQTTSMYKKRKKNDNDADDKKKKHAIRKNRK